jgi:predicted secreted protein
MAVSYEATCFGLLAHKILDHGTVERIRSVAPKEIKKRLLREVALENSWSDVWLLDEHDNGGTIDAGPGDAFVVNLVEHGGSGYLWDRQPLEAAGFKIEEDTLEDDSTDAVGGPNRLRLVLKDQSPGVRKLALVERRPWEATGTPLKAVSISVSTYGAESEGLSRQLRRELEQPALH